MAKTKITTKGQITIPIEIRRKLGLKPGQELEFDLNSPYVKAVKIVKSTKMKKAIGCLKHVKESVDEILDSLRGEHK